MIMKIYAATFADPVLLSLVQGSSYFVPEAKGDLPRKKWAATVVSVTSGIKTG